MWYLLQIASADAWLALLGVVVGSALTIIGVYLTNRAAALNLATQLEHEKQNHLERTTKERLEELYVLVNNWLNMLASMYLTLTSVMQGKLDYNQYLDLLVKWGNEQKYDFSRLDMIIGIYGSDSRAAYDEVLKARTRLNEIVADHKHAYKRGEPGDGFIGIFVAAQVELEEAGEKLKESVAKAARTA